MGVKVVLLLACCVLFSQNVHSAAIRTLLSLSGEGAVGEQCGDDAGIRIIYPSARQIFDTIDTVDDPGVSGFKFEAGSEYIYHYSTDVALNEPDLASKHSQPKKDVGFKLTADVSLKPVWSDKKRMLIKLDLLEPEVHSVAWDSVLKDASVLGEHSLYIHWEGTRIKRVFSAGNDPSWSINIKLGVASLLQMQQKDGQREEIDISGKCTAEYKKEGTSIVKTKRDCSPLHGMPEFFHANEVLGTKVESKAEVKYEFYNDAVQSLQSTETQTSRVNMHTTAALQATTSQSLKLGKIDTASGKVQASTMEEAVTLISRDNSLALSEKKLVAMVTQRGCTCRKECKCSQFVELVAQHSTSLELSSHAKEEAASAYLDLLASARTADKQAILDVLNNDYNYAIIGSLVDILAAAQTVATQEALMEFLNFDETYDITLAERYLVAAMFSSHPIEKLLQDLLNLYNRDVEDMRLRETIGETMGAVLYTFYRQGNQEHKIIQEIQTAVLEKLSQCTDSKCRQMQLFVLTNAALPETLGALVDIAESSPEAAVSEAAIKALRRFDKKLINEQVVVPVSNKDGRKVSKILKIRAALMRIFRQSKRYYDTVVRNCALAVLLVDPSLAEVVSILESTTEPGQGEMSLYTQGKLAMAAKEFPTIREHVKEALKDESLNNYDILAPKGKSLSFKELMGGTSSVTSNYMMYMENGKKVLKRSGLDVDMTVNDKTSTLISFGIFVTGLESLLGEEMAPGEEDVEATGGMGLTLLDVSLRPITFFVGNGGLMSAVWNAPPDLTPALQINVLLQDSSQYIPLMNGLTVELNQQGSLSLDISGSAAISLWSKNAHSVIRNSGAMVMKGSMKIDTGSFKTGVSFSAATDFLVDFTTDVDFYTDPISCLQMDRPDSTFRYNVNKHESVMGAKKGYVSRTRRVVHLNSASYPLPKPNNDQCRQLLAAGAL